MNYSRPLDKSEKAVTSQVFKSEISLNRPVILKEVRAKLKTHPVLRLLAPHDQDPTLSGH